MPSVLRNLSSRDLPALRELLSRDPVGHCFVASRLTPGMDPWRLGGEMWGWVEDGELVSACYAGANLVPIETNEQARAAIAQRARQQGRRCSSIVGYANEALDLHEQLRNSWSPPRDIRRRQHLMAVTGQPSVEPDPRVRTLGLEHLDALLPASIAMFTEEVGISPISGGAGPAYRARVAELVTQGRAFAILDSDGGIAFKAEIGAVSPGACQIQGVWVAPHLRGNGLAKAGMAAVVERSRSVAPIVSLYVNDYNIAAVRTYEAVGFEKVGTFATILY